MYEFIMSVDGEQVAEDDSPSKKKLEAIPGGFVVQDVKGIRARVTTRLDGRGYDVTKRMCIILVGANQCAEVVL